MNESEALTVTLPPEVIAAIRGAVEGGEYASSSEVVQEALEAWRAKRAAGKREMEALKADIAEGMRDLAEERVREFDLARIVERGRALLAARSRSG